MTLSRIAGRLPLAIRGPSSLRLIVQFSRCIFTTSPVLGGDLQASMDSHPITKIPLGEPRKLPPLTEEQKKNWVSLGFSYESKELDRKMFNRYVFVLMNCIIWGVLMLSYEPDLKQYCWAHREAVFELHRRRELGLLPVSPDLIPRERMIKSLPPDSEIGENELII